MDLKWPLLLLLLLVLLPAAYALAVRFLPDPPTPEGLPVAHAARLRALPRFRELARQQLLLTQVQLLSVGLVLVGSVWLAARPMHTEIVDKPARPGDIVVCVDLTAGARSGALEALTGLRTLIPTLRDEPVRLGIQGFQSSTGELLALTDDMGQAELSVTETQETLRGLGVGSGTGPATGDGLATCAEAFDAPASRRGRAVVLIGSGTSQGSVLSLGEAAAVARDRKVTIYAIPVGGSAGGRQDLQAAADLTGGQVITGADPVDAFWSREAVRLDPPPRPVRRDGPFTPTVVVLLGLGGLLLAGLRGLFR